MASPVGFPSPRRLAVAALAGLLAACGPGPTAAPSASPIPSSTPAASPSGTPRPQAATKLAEIRSAVIEIRGLRPEGDVEPRVIDEATLRSNLEAEFDSENTPEELAVLEDLYVALGLLQPGVSLRDAQLDLLSGQVVGYYSPSRDELYVVSRSGGVGPVEWSTYAHEFVHQLQDQRFDLDSLGLDATDQSDRALAAQALIEGDASAAQTSWMQASLTPEELGEVFQASLDPAGLDALRRAPAVLRELALYPYRDGLFFVNGLMADGGFAAVDAAYANLPASTEQVLHVGAYLAGERPIEVTPPDGLPARLGAGWTEAGRDTLGELMLRIWLRNGGLDANDAARGAAGWGGDRVVLLRGPDGALAAALSTEWDAPAEASEFVSVAQAAISGLGLDARIVRTGRPTAVSIAFGAQVEVLAAALAE